MAANADESINILTAIVPALFWALAAICNALMDSVDTAIAFQASIFRHRSIAFWCKAVAAHNIQFIRGTRYRPDAWHIAKSIMLMCMGATAVSYQVVSYWWLDFFALGAIWLLVFNLFYNRVFKHPNQRPKWRINYQ